ncbi:MAG: threonine--tRNA ligase [Clostridia bacterium]
MNLTLKDGTKLEVESGLNAFDCAKKISEGLARASVAVKLNGEIKDLRTIVDNDCAFEVLTFQNEEGKEIYRHSAAHLLAQAVKVLYPTAKLGIGPAVDSGFYYDIEFDHQITEEELEKIEAVMKKIVKENDRIERFELPKSEAIDLMQKRNEPYKVEMIKELPDDVVLSFYKQGDYVDFCKGPHVMSTGAIKAFKLLQITGAYWRGNDKNKMLTRIYGTAFDNKTDMEEYLKRLEEAKLRDHNKLGREMKIFTTDENVGQGLPLIMPNGAKIMQTLIRFVEDEEERRGYVMTKTPYMAKSDLYKISGHWAHYKDGMFVLGDEEKDDEVLALRPMTCPFQYMIYKADLHSYRDLPMRYGETSTLFRNENSGEMHGLIRVRQFTISEGHLIVRPDQLADEFKGVLDLVYYMLDCTGLREDVSFRFSKWDPNNREKYEGDAAEWDDVQKAMKKILDDLNLNYYEAEGEAAFYGPKLDIQAKNVYGKEDTIITIQIDFMAGKKFNMEYTDVDGKKKNPYVIHRTSIGCYERTMAMLIEKYYGALPIWIMPTQVTVMSLTDRTIEQAKAVADKLRMAGIRVKLDTRAEKLGYKIREAQLDRIPYMVILGDKDVESGVISVRNRKVGDIGQTSVEEFTEKVLNEIKTFSREF